MVLAIPSYYWQIFYVMHDNVNMTINQTREFQFISHFYNASDNKMWWQRYKLDCIFCFHIVFATWRVKDCVLLSFEFIYSLYPRLLLIFKLLWDAIHLVPVIWRITGAKLPNLRV
jgi:hypothetical protein